METYSNSSKKYTPYVNSNDRKTKRNKYKYL